MKIVTIVGARPQFVKAAAVSRILRSRENVEEFLIHTGQHFDANMSQIFFDELGIDEPKYNLGISGGSHGDMTGRMLSGIEAVLENERPDWTLIYGDTNSTLAAAIAASKMHIPVAHVEAGLRSFNMKMPEEINRILSDRVSSLLLCPTDTAVQNLSNEGITAGVSNVGDVMYDAALHFGDLADQKTDEIIARYGLHPGGFALATCHRAENTDDPARLEQILQALSRIANDCQVVLPLHPRTRSCIRDLSLGHYLENIMALDPVPYLEMLWLEKNANLILTDSGGVQKEAFFFEVPCVTMRDETEWVETIDAGWNILAGVQAERIVQAVKDHKTNAKLEVLPYGNGHAAELISDKLLGL